MTFLILFLFSLSLASYAQEHSVLSNSSGSPRELQIQGEVKRTPQFKKGQLKAITFSAVFQSGNSIETTCTFRGNKESKYSGKVIKNGQEAIISETSAAEDYMRLQRIYLQKNSNPQAPLQK